MERIIINPFSSFLSAYGLANSLQKHTNQKTLLLEITNNNINKIIKTIEKLKLKNSINFKIQKLNHNIIIYLKYLGTEQSLSIRVREDELYADNIIRKFIKNYLDMSQIRRLLLKWFNWKPLHQAERTL